MPRKSDAGSAATAGLLERPLTARSVIASLLLGRHPPAAPASLLVRWCALFGVSDTSARVALTRMAQSGELNATDGTYELVGRIRDRQVEQDFALSPQLRRWVGDWTVAVVRPGPRSASARVTLRRALDHARMKSLRDGVWLRPDNLPRNDAAGLDQCMWFTARPTEADAVELVRLWDCESFDRRAGSLLERLLAVAARLPHEDALADGFVTGAAAAQHLRRDPLLPAQLLPPTWRVDELRHAYLDYLRVFNAAVATWADSA